MSGVAFDVNGAEGAGRAKGLAFSASDATLGVDRRNLGRGIVAGDGMNHRYCSGGTISRAGSATYAVGKDDAIVFEPHGVAPLYGGFLRRGDGADGSGRTHLRTARAFRATITALVGALGLHQPRGVGRGTKHAVGAYGHTQLAGRATAREMSLPDSAWREDRDRAHGHFLSTRTARPPSTLAL